MTSTKPNTDKNPDRSGRLRNEHQLATTAILYYREGLTQSEIAKRLGISRATVVNHLKTARELGIVDIRIEGASFATSTLSKVIKTRFDLEDVYISSVYDDDSSAGLQFENDIMRQTARVAAMALCDIVTQDDILGVAWGKTIQIVAEELPALDKPGLSVFQMIGSMKSPLLMAAETCAINIANSFAAECHTLPAPAILSTAKLAKTLRAEPIIKTHLEKLGSVNKSLFSVGSCEPRTHLVTSGIASLEDLHWYVEHGAVGVICGRFIDRNGEHVVGPLDQRMIGIDPGQLQKVETGIMVFSGLHKLEAALAAIRGGYAAHLIVDERSGTELLKLVDNP